MSPSFSALQATRQHLVLQLVYFDEQYPNFSDTYLSGFIGSDRAGVERKIRLYNDTLADLLAQNDTELAERLQSLVLIGSQVKVHYEEDGYEESFTVVYPTESDPDKNRISFLSPFGRELLCAPPGRSLTVDVPNGKLPIAVRETRFAYIGGFSTESM